MLVPQWNVFSQKLVAGTMDLAHEYLADEGFLVTICLAEHIGEFIIASAQVGLALHRTWNLFCDTNPYRHPNTHEAVRTQIFLSDNCFIFCDKLLHCMCAFYDVISGFRFNHLSVVSNGKSHALIQSRGWQSH